jgi:hypothetical protein
MLMLKEPGNGFRPEMLPRISIGIPTNLTEERPKIVRLQMSKLRILVGGITLVVQLIRHFVRQMHCQSLRQDRQPRSPQLGNQQDRHLLFRVLLHLPVPL